MLSSRLKAFVIPTSQRSASGPRDDLRVDELDAVPVTSDDAAPRELRGELRERRQRTQVVDEAGDEEDRDARRRCRRARDVEPDRADRDRQPEPDA